MQRVSISLVAALVGVSILHACSGGDAGGAGGSTGGTGGVDSGIGGIGGSTGGTGGSTGGTGGSTGGTGGSTGGTGGVDSGIGGTGGSTSGTSGVDSGTGGTPQDGGQTASHLWSKSFGDPMGALIGYAAATDGSGNVAITGVFSGPLDFGGGTLPSGHIFVAKFDASGNHLWSKSFASDAETFTGYTDAGVAIDSVGNVVITGHFASSAGSTDFGGGALPNAGAEDIFVAKFDANGNHLWSKSFGGTSSDGGSAVGIDGSSNVLITGYVGVGDVDFGGGALPGADRGSFVAKYDANGNHVWSKRFDGGSNNDYGKSVAADGSGDVVVTGSVQGTVDFGGGPLAPYSRDIFLAKFDTNGNHLWSRIFGDNGYDWGTDVVTDSSGNVLMTGAFENAVDFGGGWLLRGASDCCSTFVAKFDGNGNHDWSKAFGPLSASSTAFNPAFAESVATDSSGNMLITGASTGIVDFGGSTRTVQEIFLTKFDANGNHLWSKIFGDESGQLNWSRGNSVATDGSDNILIAGFFGGSVDFGGGPLTSYAGDIFYDSDIFLAKFAP